MVSPDSRIDPNDRINPSQDDDAETARRKNQPNRDFNQVAERLEKFPPKKEDEEGTLKDSKKKMTSRTPKMDTSSQQAASIFDLARAGVNTEDEEEEETNEETLISEESEEMESSKNTKLGALKGVLFSDETTEEGVKGTNFAAALKGSTIKGSQNARLREIDDEEKEDETFSASKSSPFELASKKRGRFEAIEQPDLAALAPQLNQQQPKQVINPIETSVSSISNVPIKYTTNDRIQEIADLIEKAIVTQDLKKGETETVVSLTGAFDKSRIIITESQTAPGQINVTIDNLTSNNQKLLLANEHLLREKLERKDIVLQMFVPTTAQESTKADVILSQESRQQQQQQQQQDAFGKNKGQQQQNEDQEEES